MDRTNRIKNQHLLWRAGFGPMAEDLHALSTTSQKSILQVLWKGSAGDPAPVTISDEDLRSRMMQRAEAGPMGRKEMSADEKKEIRRQSEQDIRTLNLTWLNEMVNSNAQLREKMALFWHGHFASRVQNVFYQQSLLDTIRQHALGNFGDLLKQVSMSASMINFLNNNQNRKDHPNENFAREVMELFTMGRGNYTEQDVKEGARAFTGWGVNFQGQFEFRKRQHDDEQKTFLGKTGHFDGNDILNMLLAQKATARYITRKLYRYLVNEDVDENRVEWLAGRWYQSNYDIKSLLEDILGSDWFYEDRNIGSRIKSPIDLLVGIRRLLPMKIENEEVQLVFQRLLGQVLMYPPNVAGWPGGASWIDSSTLMFRLQLPQLIYMSGEFRQQPKADDDRMMGLPDQVGNKGSGVRGPGKGGQLIRAEIDWTAYLQRFAKLPDPELPGSIEGVLLQTRRGIGNDTVKKYAVNGSREEFIKTVTIRLMCTPEYQLC